MNKKILKILSCTLLTGLICIGYTTKAYAWDGKEDGTGTHSVIVTQAIEVLKHDLAKDEPEAIRNNLSILEENLHKFQLGSTFPDYDPNAYSLYQDHFWDPDTDHNFTQDNKWYLSYAVPDNAESQTRKFAALAKNEWAKGNYEKAVWYLGQGMHYFGDLNTPYHAANVTAVDSPGHVKFETYAEERKDTYRLDTTGYNTDDAFYKDTLKNDNFNEWSKGYCKYWAKQAKDLYYSHATMSNSWDDWEYAASHGVGNAQKGVAGYLYRFLNDVSNKDAVDKDYNLNEIVVMIKTADVQDAGTDNYIYFGIETKDGVKEEWALDNPGNDFTRNQEGTYTLKLKNKNIKYSDIKNMWIRDEKLTVATDGWKPSYVKVIAGDKVRLEKNINEWISGGTTYPLN
ncbi:phospholipase C [Clostridium sardiniense]|uniref:phospholipase C n=1 Tax=Clostridium sardiniense TaxID=29369 RepID=UPI0019580337|nr:phospholipase C [Clostridium sardiniense]MBM7835651.1 phospholipase C/alpha-toxin [Clostridium sardiniense]